MMNKPEQTPFLHTASTANNTPASQEHPPADANGCNTRALAAFYAVTAGICSWLLGCFLVVLWTNIFQRAPIGALIRMFCYHIHYFYLYLAIIDLFYMVFLYFWLRYHPRNKVLYGLFSLAGLVLIVSLSAFPCGVLYELQDMLSGFYPNDIPAKLFGNWMAFVPVCWLTVFLSPVPFLVGIIWFFAVNRFCINRFSAQRQPWLYRKLVQWNTRYPARLFLIVGTASFVIAIGCGLGNIEYTESSFRHGIYIPQWRPFGWLIIGGLIFPIVEFLAFCLAACCWYCRFLSRRLAWAVLLAGTTALAVFGIWQTLPQHVFIQSMGEAYQKSMRLDKLYRKDSFNDGITTRGEFHYRGDLLAELRQAGKLNADGTLPVGAFTLYLTPLRDGVYSFESRPPPRQK